MKAEWIGGQIHPAKAGWYFYQSTSGVPPKIAYYDEWHGWCESDYLKAKNTHIRKPKYWATIDMPEPRSE